MMTANLFVPSDTWRKDTEKTFGEAGFEVRTFISSETWREALVEKIPSLAVVEFDVSGFGGTLIKETRMIFPDLPVVALLNGFSPESARNAFGCGATDIVGLPPLPEEIAARVLPRVRADEDKDVAALGRAHVATILAMAKLAEFRDTDTGDHIVRTGEICRRIALYVSGNPRCGREVRFGFAEEISNAAKMHDIGKVGMPDNILLKPGKLAPEEREVMERHSALGASILDDVHSYERNSLVEMGREIALNHHEKWDGSGYPERLYGENIPLSARIMSIVDVYDALRSRRPYKEPMSRERAMGIILEGSGKAFDPVLVDIFTMVEPEMEFLYPFS